MIWFHIYLFKENETDENRKISLSEHALISPKWTKTADSSKCIVCQESTTEKLINLPGNIKQLLLCVKYRASYENFRYKELKKSNQHFELKCTIDHVVVMQPRIRLK